MKKTGLLFIIFFVLSLAFSSINVNADSMPILVVNLNSPGNGASYIQLEWGDMSSSGVYYYVAERKIDSEDYTEISGYINSSISNSYGDVLLATSVGSTLSYRIAVYDKNYKFIDYTNVVSFVLTDISEPKNFTAKNIGNDTMALSWEYTGTAPISTVIERKDGDTNTWTQIGGTIGNVHYFEDTDVEQGKTYTYRIKSMLGANCYSKYTETSETKAELKKPSVFNVSLVYLPTSSTSASKQHALIEWSNIWSQDVIVTIERKDNNGTFTNIAELSNNEWIYLDEDITSGNTYTYRIYAKNKYYQDLKSPYSEEITIIAIDLRAPAGISAMATSNTTAEISWQDNSNNETGFEIWRCNGNGTAWVKYATVPANTRSFKDINLTPATTYSYKVRAFSAIANVHSYFTSEVTVKTIVPTANIVLDYSINTSNIPTITWKLTGSVKDGSTLQLEKKGEYDVTWSNLTTFSPDSISFTDTVLKQYTRYSYRIRLVDTQNNSSSLSNTLVFAPGIPDSPVGLESTALGANTVQLSWTDKSMNEDGYIIERYVSDIGFVQVAKVPSGQTTYIDNMLTPGQGYTYRVSAYNKSGISGYTNEKYFLSKNPSVFYDMSDSSWALDAVLNLADTGIIGGTSQGYFSPDNNISRAEFTSMVIKALKIKAQNTLGFYDTKPSDWYYNDLLTAKAYGIVNGTDGYFYPDTPITREDMSVILCKALEAINKPLAGKNPSILDDYADRSMVSDYTVSSLSSMKAAGLLNGKDGNMLAPKDYLSRAEAAEIIWRVINK